MFGIYRLSVEREKLLTQIWMWKHGVQAIFQWAAGGQYVILHNKIGWRKIKTRQLEEKSKHASLAEKNGFGSA
jgi:hypothetical protein